MICNGNGNGTMMVSQEPQLREVGLTQVIPGSGPLETLVIETEPWLTIARPLLSPGSNEYLVSPSDLIMNALSNAMGHPVNKTRVLVKLQIMVEVIGYQQISELDEGDRKALQFIGCTPAALEQTDPALDAVVPRRNDDNEEF